MDHLIVLITCFAFVFGISTIYDKIVNNRCNIHERMISSILCVSFVAIFIGVGIKSMICVALIAGACTVIATYLLKRILKF
jgi:hypothetical protein